MARRTKAAVFGFRDQTPIVRSLGRTLRYPARMVADGRYPSGELALRIKGPIPARAIVAAVVGERDSSVLRTLFLAHSLRDAGAKRVELVAPWIAYGRQDRRVPESEGVGLALGRLFAASFDRIVTLDAHSPAFIRSFRSRLGNVLPDPEIMGPRPDVVVAPDKGARTRAERVARHFHAPLIVLKKERTRTGKRSVFARVRDHRFVTNAAALIVDDMADTGGTLVAAVRSLRGADVRSVRVFVTHAFHLANLRTHLKRQHVTDVRTAFDHAGERVDGILLARLARSLQ